MNNISHAGLLASVNFLFEMGILAYTPRSAFAFLGMGEQSVAEHINRTAYVGMVLASLDGSVDTARVIQMCLFHDIAEARTSDLNYVHQQYGRLDEQKALQELMRALPCGAYIDDLMHEYEARQSKEAILAKDADNLEWLLSLKELMDLGNVRALKMAQNASKRLVSEVAKQLAMQIMNTLSDAWYTDTKDEKWWISRIK